MNFYLILCRGLLKNESLLIIFSKTRKDNQISINTAWVLKTVISTHSPPGYAFLSAMNDMTKKKDVYLLRSYMQFKGHIISATLTPSDA